MHLTSNCILKWIPDRCNLKEKWNYKKLEEIVGKYSVNLEVNKGILSSKSLEEITKENMERFAKLEIENVWMLNTLHIKSNPQIRWNMTVG